MRRKDTLEIIRLLKLIFRYSMFCSKNVKVENILLEHINNLKSYLNKIYFNQPADLNNDSSLNKIIDMTTNINKLFYAKQFKEIAITANNLYHQISTDSGYVINEYDFEILTDDTLTCKIDKNLLTPKIIVILDNIRSPFNVGSIIRVSEATAVEKILITGFTPDINHQRVKRAAMSAENNIEIIKFVDINTAIEFVKKDDYKIFIVELTTKSKNYKTINYNEFDKIAIVFGNEEFGVDETIFSCCDYCIHLNMFGKKNSINVACAATAVLFQIRN